MVLLLYFRRYFKSIFLFLIILLSLFAVYKPLNSRIKEISRLDQTSTKGHLGLYLGAWKIFLQSPLSGAGVGTWRQLGRLEAVKDMRKKLAMWTWPDAHNMFLQTAA
jgi:O-antigen ligase